MVRQYYIVHITRIVHMLLGRLTLSTFCGVRQVTDAAAAVLFVSTLFHRLYTYMLCTIHIVSYTVGVAAAVAVMLVLGVCLL